MNYALTRWPMLDDVIWTVATLAIGYAVGRLINRIVINRLQRLVAGTAADWDDAVVAELQRRLPLWGVLVAAWFSVGYWPLGADANTYTKNVFFALVVLSVATALAGIAVRLLTSFGPRLNPDMQVSGLMRNVVRLTIFTVGLLVILDSINVQITPILAALGVGGLAVALALQDPLANLFAGLFITLAGQIRIGDHIKLEPGPEGTVVDFSWNATQLATGGGNIVIIPNAKVTQSLITNFHRPARESGFSIEFVVTTDADLAAVERIGIGVAREVMKDVPGGIAGFEPSVRFVAYTDLGIRVGLNVRSRDFADQPLIRHEVIRRLNPALAREGIAVATAPKMRTLPEEGIEPTRGVNPTRF